MAQLLIKSGRCVNPNCTFIADLLINEGRIVAIGENINVEAEIKVDASGKLVLPGGIDVHVHLPWPFGEVTSSDDFQSGTKAAAFGGVTTVFDFAIPEGGESLSEALKRKVSNANGNGWVDYGFHIAIRGRHKGMLAEIPEIVNQGFPSFKVYMAYEGFRIEDGDLLRVMNVIKDANGVMMVHAENGVLADYLTDVLTTNNRTSLNNYPSARPTICEVEAINRILSYAKVLGTQVHVAHVSTASGAELIGQARRRGQNVTGETCPHYLLFNEEMYLGDPSEAAHLVCAPSIKSMDDQIELWRALKVDNLSILSTDHCPYLKEQKEKNLKDFNTVPGGLAGVETRLPLIYTEGVTKGKLSLQRFVEIWSTNAAKAFGLFPNKGIISIGSDADLVIIDPKAETELHAEELHMSSNCLPFEGWRVQGIPEMTILRGQILTEGGRLHLEKPPGKLLYRKTTDRIEL